MATARNRWQGLAMMLFAQLTTAQLAPPQFAKRTDENDGRDEHVEALKQQTLPRWRR